MPRQPFLPAYADRRYVVGALVLKDRDELAALIGKMIALWSQVDNEMGTLFSLLLGTQSDAALEVFLSLRRMSNQREVLAAAAKFKLQAGDLKIFSALMRVYGWLESERNNLAHCCYGVCPDDATLLFTIDVKHHVHFIVETLSREARGQFSADRHARLKEHMYVYRKSDLERLFLDMEKFWWTIFYFNGYLRDTTNKDRRAELDRAIEDSALKGILAASA